MQIDVKFIEPITTAAGTRKRFYQYTAIDDCTRLRISRNYPRSDQKTAIQFLDYVLSRLPFQVEKVQTDNGAEFQTPFHWHVLDQGIGQHIYIRPATPRLNGKVERSHRIDAEEFYRQLDGVVIDDAGVFNDKLKEWEDYYNYHRPHSGLGGQTPYERLLQKTQIQPVTSQRQLHNRPVRGPYSGRAGSAYQTTLDRATQRIKPPGAGQAPCHRPTLAEPTARVARHRTSILPVRLPQTRRLSDGQDRLSQARDVCLASKSPLGHQLHPYRQGGTLASSVPPRRRCGRFPCSTSRGVSAVLPARRTWSPSGQGQRFHTRW